MGYGRWPGQAPTNSTNSTNSKKSINETNSTSLSFFNYSWLKAKKRSNSTEWIVKLIGSSSAADGRRLITNNKDKSNLSSFFNWMLAQLPHSIKKRRKTNQQLKKESNSPQRQPIPQLHSTLLHWSLLWLAAPRSGLVSRLLICFHWRVWFHWFHYISSISSIRFIQQNNCALSSSFCFIHLFHSSISLSRRSLSLGGAIGGQPPITHPKKGRGEIDSFNFMNCAAPMEQQLFLSFNQINFKFDLMKEKGWTVPLA